MGAFTVIDMAARPEIYCQCRQEDRFMGWSGYLPRSEKSSFLSRRIIENSICTRMKPFAHSKRILTILILFPLIIISCDKAIDPNMDYQGERTSIGEYLNSKLDLMTWDEAIMTWGEPGSTFNGDEVFLATWGGQKSGRAIFPINKMIFIAPIESGWQLRLTFNKKTRKLASWQYEKW